MGGSDPYSASKGCCEIIAAAYRRSFFPPEQAARHGVSLASVRAGNVIGGGDWAQDRILPDSVRSLMASQAIPVRRPDAIRPWQHVLEPLGGYLLLASRQWQDPAGLAEGWNFGPGSADSVTVREVVKMTLSAWGGGTWEDRSAGEHLHEAHALQLDVSKAASRLGWRPALSVQEAVRDTVRWYRRRADGRFDAAAECIGQIQGYCERAAK
jgi:CDP-glucose 4,6-dehydratase